MSARIEGLEQCLRRFDQSPANLVKVTRTAMREAARAESRHEKGEVPARFKRLVRHKVSKSRTGDLRATVGMFDGNEVNGHQGKEPRSDWFKAYWLNYGTLEGRDPEHRFKNKVRPKTQAVAKRQKNRTGIVHRNFYEQAKAGYRERFLKTFRESLKKQEDKIL